MAVEIPGSDRTNEAWAHCNSCGREWLVAQVPMLLDAFARILMAHGRTCPYCNGPGAQVHWGKKGTGGLLWKNRG